MAITLSVQITDTEQAKIVELAEVIAPGMTPAQLKTWAEKECKRLLRQRLFSIAESKRIAAEQAASAAEVNAFEAAWPNDTEPV